MSLKDHTGERRLNTCAAEFAELKGKTDNLAAADTQHARAVAGLTKTIKDGRDERRVDHKELVGKLDGFIVDHEKRVTTVEVSTRSAHHRLNAFRNIMVTLGSGVLLTIIGWLLTRG
jgi:hypothetical protein